MKSKETGGFCDIKRDIWVMSIIEIKRDRWLMSIIEIKRDRWFMSIIEIKRDRWFMSIIEIKRDRRFMSIIDKKNDNKIFQTRYYFITQRCKMQSKIMTWPLKEHREFFNLLILLLNLLRFKCLGSFNVVFH